MTYLLLVIYIVAFGWWLKSTPSMAQTGLPRTFIFCIFISKISLGLLYGLIHHTYFKGGDTFIYLQESTLIGRTFLDHPNYYISSILGWDIAAPNAEVFTYPDAWFWWKDLGTYALVHLHALLYPFTFGHYELHIFFIAIIGLFASLNFYKIFQTILELPPLILIICCFFLPSISFWTAGLHKDAYVYFGLSLFWVGLLELQQNARNNKTFLKLIGGLLVIGLARHYLLLLLCPATIAYFLSFKCNSKQTLGVYISVYTTFLFLSFVLTKELWGADLFQILVDKQAAFSSEIGGSSIQNIEPLNPSIIGVVSMIPMAFINVLSRPFLWECQDFLQFLASIEILSFLVLLFISFAIKKNQIKKPNSLIYLIVTYTISNLLLVGLLVSNIGTIARYRAIALGILSALLMHILDFYQLYFQKETPIIPQKQSFSPPAISNNKKKILR